MTYLVITAGRYDILVEIYAGDDSELLDVLSRQVRTIPGVLTTETFAHLEVRKDSYSWGIR